MPLTHCPHLGLSEDPSLHLSYPDRRHHCFASPAPAEIELHDQERLCLTEGHTACPRYVTPPEPGRPQPRPLAAETEAGADEALAPPFPWWRSLLWGTALVLLALVVWRYGSILMPPDHPSPASAQATVSLPPTPDHAPSPTPTPFPAVNPTPAPTSPPVLLPTATPTPWPEGRIFTLNPSAGAVGWVASNETRGNHFGDSFIHSGTHDGVIFHGAWQFDLSRIAPGTPLHAAALHLTGLSDQRLGEGGTWEVRILSKEVNEDWSRQTFQTLHNAVAEQALLPVLGHDDLIVGRDNVFAFNEEQLRLLEGRLLDGAISFRLDGPQTGSNNVFAWDSGYGPASRGQGPVLWISAGPPPRTPLPTATIEYVVVTSTPTPENVLTAAAMLRTATAQAIMTGTPTPLPPNVATPTPTTSLIVVTPTPTPQNAATATAISAYATAIALTTGTFTPTPPNVATATPTPTFVIVTATPTPESALAALATAIAEATRQAREGTATPLPANWVVAIVVTATPTPENGATATAISARATIVALTKGTFTPTPFYMFTATPTPTGTPMPLLIYLDKLTPTPTTTPTPTPLPPSIPAVLRGKIAFLSDRSGQVAVYVMEPDGSRVALLTSRWPYELALKAQQWSPDGNYRVFVGPNAQVHVEFPQSGGSWEVSRTGSGIAYDPAWSPVDDRIVFVSDESGMGEEIYVVRSNGDELRRLTYNEFIWDKFPTWSPDGTQIAFWSNRTGRRQIWVMNADGSEQRNLSNNPYNDWDPVWIR
ncbi:MAG: hypothetical protein QHJ81_16325 [Anaerolineae bacterium]|nr:hypothetical protein [Anaerolineae bacterium]